MHLWLKTTLALAAFSMVAQAAEKKISLTITGGHDTDPKDRGRPVILIAAALGVTPEVFREAFSGVTPARNGRPSSEEARRNKDALMRVLKPHGISNDRLDEVSNYYRYQPQKGELWKTTPAKGHALIEEGKIKQIVVTDPGSGYSSSPKVTVAGFEKTKLKTALLFDKNLKKNGSIKSIEVVSSESSKSSQ